MFFYEVAVCLEVRIWLLQVWPTSQRPRATFIAVLQQRATSYMGTHEHIPIFSSFTHILLLN